LLCFNGFRTNDFYSVSCVFDQVAPRDLIAIKCNFSATCVSNINLWLSIDIFVYASACL
jgi:hypothetical protein